MRPTILQAGRLGEFTFPAGVYLYFGSACGPGGLRGRLTRYLFPAHTQRLHWHIDCLRAVAEVRATGYLVLSCQEQAGQPLECLWSQAVASLPGGLAPAPGFGASDCRSRCPAHLLMIQEPEAANEPVLLKPWMQNILANATSLSKAGRDLCWLKVDQSLIAPLG